ncbi:MAG: valine--tRNA ligase [Gammaproteobacteria bacterium]|nr:MAG: valine--tRNA ligase [Gammaproteobacteria bacterium]
MEKTYDPHAIERRWYEYWESSGHFAPTGDGEPYVIMIPPPNVTGTLHMGHAFQDTLMDTLIRYHRMRGHRTLWQPGTDHAGIATQMIVERQINREGKTRHDLGREAFLERVWEWKAESGGTITRQLRRLGASLDWPRERFTMDDGMSAAVHEIFIRLHKDGLIYRGKRLVNWDPVLHTALSDLEVLSEEEQGSLWHFRYPLSDGSGSVVVATTRPETMLGDTAVAVHPDDERYRNLIGRTITLPLVGREIPVIADDYVDPEFGSGCVKITPAHDFNDYAIGQRHALDIINILNDDASLNDAVPEAYRGLDRFEARKRVVADLDAAGNLEKTEAHRLMVPRGDRSGTVVEPYLTDQWYVDLTRETQDDGRPGGLARITRPALDVVANGSIRFVPGNYKRTYDQWLENIEDWCISRQLWWGHRIPAWYDDAGNVYVGDSEAAVRAENGIDDAVALRQDEDVLDTWFSSALWPFSTLGWPEKTAALDEFYPGSVLVTGFDIIFFWVARMIMFGTYALDEVPFRDVYIHGLVRDAHGHKMSKSKGNVLDPLDIIDGIELDALLEKRTANLMQDHKRDAIVADTKKHYPDGIPSYGTDALRFTFASLATTGRDISFDLKRVEGYRNFCNKLFNATRYVLMNTEALADENHEASPADSVWPADFASRNVVDRWIITRAQEMADSVAGHIAEYRFDLAATAIYEFVWNEYCDWYLEMAKPVLTGEADEAAKLATRQTLVEVLERTLRVTHPFMPFITEELWQQVAPLAGIPVVNATVSLQPWPERIDAAIDIDAASEIDWVREVVMGVRRIRSEMNINPGKRLPLLVGNAAAKERELLAGHDELIRFLARIEGIEILDAGADEPDAAVQLVGDMRLLIPMAGLINKEAELARLAREIDKLDKQVKALTGKLANEGFTTKAPPAVVEAERQKLVDNENAVAQLREQEAKIRAL